MVQLKFSQFPIAMEAAISRHCWKKMFWEFEKQNNGKLLKIHTNSRKNTCEGTPSPPSQVFSTILPKFYVHLPRTALYDYSG